MVGRKRSGGTQTAEAAITNAMGLLEELATSLESSSLRPQILRLVEIQELLRETARELGAAHRPDARSGKARLKAYLKAHPGARLGGSELAMISGVSQYARRIRELRVDGLGVLAGPCTVPGSNHRLRADEYLLSSP
jgi:hypothetical protein